MKKLGLIISSILLATTLTSCNGDSKTSFGEATPSGKGGVATNASASTSGSKVVSSEVSAAESLLATANKELNQSQTYALTKDELDLLLSNNEISQQEYSELLALTK